MSLNLLAKTFTIQLQWPINIVMDSRYAIKRNQMRQRRLSTEIESINHRLEGSLYLIEHEVKEIKKDQEKHFEPDPEINISYLKRKSESNPMDSPRRRASSFSVSDSASGKESPRKPNAREGRRDSISKLHEHENRRDSISKHHKVESPIAEYIASPVPHSYARSRRMSLPANFVHPIETLSSGHSLRGTGQGKGSSQNLKGSKGDVRRSRDNITRSRDSSPSEMEKYENQMRRLKRELNQRKPKTIKQLERVPLTSTEETHLIHYLKETEHKKMLEKRNAELLEGLKNCTYLRTNNPQELTVEEILDTK